MSRRAYLMTRVANIMYSKLWRCLWFVLRAFYLTPFHFRYISIPCRPSLKLRTGPPVRMFHPGWLEDFQFQFPIFSLPLSGTWSLEDKSSQNEFPWLLTFFSINIDQNGPIDAKIKIIPWWPPLFYSNK